MIFFQKNSNISFSVTDMTGESIKKVLAEHGIKIKELAARLGESQQNMSALLMSQDVKSGTIERVSGATGIPLTEFFGLAPMVTNTGLNNGSIAGRDVNNHTGADSMQELIRSQQETIRRLSEAIAALSKK